MNYQGIINELTDSSFSNELSRTDKRVKRVEYVVSYFSSV